MTHYPFWPLTIAASLCFLAWVSGRLKRNAQALRLELADKGEAVLACPDTSERGRVIVRSYLDSAFSSRAQLLLALFVVPFLAGLKAMRTIRGDNASLEPFKEPNAQVQKLIEQITDLHLRVTLANNPILSVTNLLILAICFGLSHVVVAIVAGVFPERITAEEIAQRVDYAYARIPVRLRGNSGTAAGCV